MKLYFSGEHFNRLMEQTAKGVGRKDIETKDKIHVIRAVGLRPSHNKPLNSKTVVSLDNYIQAALNPENVFSLMTQVAEKLEKDGKGVKLGLFQCLQGASSNAKVYVLSKLLNGNMTTSTMKTEIKKLKDVEKVRTTPGHFKFIYNRTSLSD